MRANTGRTIWPKGCYRSTRVSITSLMSSSSQTWLTLTMKVEFKRLIGNVIEFVKKADNTPDCPQVRPIEIFWQFRKK